MFAKVMKRLTKGSFARNILILMTGTTISQIIPIALSPILTRLYTPEEFGLFALYISISSILSIVATGRYELAIILPEKDEDAVNIAGLTFLISCCISVLSVFFIFIFNEKIAITLGNLEIEKWLYFIPVSVLLISFYQILNYWSNRKKQFKKLALSRISQSIGTITVNLFLGSTKYVSGGLIIGGILGQGFATSFLFYQNWKETKPYTKTISINSIKRQAERYINFPKHLVFAHVLNASSNQSPVILITSLFGSIEVGYFSLAFRTLSLPIILIAGAFGDVFRQVATIEFNKNKNCRDIYVRTLKRLFAISIIPFTCFYFLAPDIFELVFGEKWRIAGEYGKTMSIMLFLRFLVGPLSIMSVIAEKTLYDLIWQLGLFIATVSSILFGYYVFHSIHYSLYLYTIIYCIMYLIDLIMTYRFSIGK